MSVDDSSRDSDFLTREESDAKANSNKVREQRPTNYGKDNKLFTEDAAEKARAILKGKLGQLNSGLDPEIMQAGLTLAGYHIEAGARKFADYARAMVNDMGDGIKPFLKSFYESARYYPGFDAAKDMDSPQLVAEADIDQLLQPVESIPPANINKVRDAKAQAAQPPSELQSVLESAKENGKARLNLASAKRKGIDEWLNDNAEVIEDNREHTLWRHDGVKIKHGKLGAQVDDYYLTSENIQKTYKKDTETISEEKPRTNWPTPLDGWRGKLAKARRYAQELGIEWRGQNMPTEKLVDEIAAMRISTLMDLMQSYQDRDSAFTASDFFDDYFDGAGVHRRENPYYYSDQVNFDDFREDARLIVGDDSNALKTLWDGQQAAKQPTPTQTPAIEHRQTARDIPEIVRIILENKADDSTFIAAHELVPDERMQLEKLLKPQERYFLSDGTYGFDLARFTPELEPPPAVSEQQVDAVLAGNSLAKWVVDQIYSRKRHGRKSRTRSYSRQRTSTLAAPRLKASIPPRMPMKTLNSA